MAAFCWLMRSLFQTTLCVASWHFFYRLLRVVLGLSHAPLACSATLVACCSLWYTQWSNTWRCRPGFYLAFCTINCSRSYIFVYDFVYNIVCRWFKKRKNIFVKMHNLLTLARFQKILMSNCRSIRNQRIRKWRNIFFEITKPLQGSYPLSEIFQDVSRDFQKNLINMMSEGKF